MSGVKQLLKLIIIQDEQKGKEGKKKEEGKEPSTSSECTIQST